MQILIVGSGIAGTATAIALQQFGYQPDIIEKSASLNFGIGGLLFSSNATEAAEALGITNALKDTAFEVGRIHYRNSNNVELLEFDTKRHFPDKKAFYSVHRNVLLTALAERLDNGLIQFGKTITKIEHLDGGVKICFNDASIKHYDLVIAADGINSSTRIDVFGETAIEDSGLSCIRLVVNRPKTLNDANYMLGKGKAVALLPIDDKLAYCPFVFCSSLLEQLNSTDSAEILTSLYGEFKGLVPEILANNRADIEKAVNMPLKSLRLKNWYENRVLLIGDAAHALIPTQPQGAAMALEDALVLAEILASTSSLNDALELYQQRRYQRVTKVQNSGYQRVDAMKLSKSSVGNFLSQAMIKLAGQRKFKSDWSTIIDETL